MNSQDTDGKSVNRSIYMKALTSICICSYFILTEIRKIFLQSNLAGRQFVQRRADRRIDVMNYKTALRELKEFFRNSWILASEMRFAYFLVKRICTALEGA